MIKMIIVFKPEPNNMSHDYLKLGLFEEGIKVHGKRSRVERKNAIRHTETNDLRLHTKKGSPN
jgi:hypothetical protein